MTIGRAEAVLIADVIDAKQRALGRACTREEMRGCVEFASETAVEAMRGTETVAYRACRDQVIQQRAEESVAKWMERHPACTPRQSALMAAYIADGRANSLDHAYQLARKRRKR